MESIFSGLDWTGLDWTGGAGSCSRFLVTRDMHFVEGPEISW